MRNQRRNRRKTAGVIRYSCGILFMLFTFCYLYCLQGEALANAQFVYSNGLTEYSLLVGAVIIPFVLQIVQWVINLASHLPNRVHALSYLPSTLLLITLSNISDLTSDSEMLKKWAVGVSAVFLIYIIICVLINKFGSNGTTHGDDDLRTLLYPNFIILLACFCGVGFLSNNNDVRIYEMKTERLLVEGDYESASKVGIKSLMSSRRLTQLRAFALSKQDKLGDELFRYPQLYGSEGMLDVADTLPHHRVNANDICLHLGAFCGASIKSSGRYLQLMLADTIWNKQTADYYLCSLLLDKELDMFNKQLPLYYNLSDSIANAYDSLPHHYKEALLMCSDEEAALKGVIKINGDSLATLSDTLYAFSYRDYLSMKATITNERERVNKTRREYGDSFWWYYDYSARK